MATEKSEFENASGGWTGVQVHDERGRGFKGIAVPRGGRVWLDEEEQTATANRPRRDEDNPFTNGTLKLVSPKQQMANRRPIGDTQEPQAPAPTQPASSPPAEQPAASGDSDAAQKPEGEMSQEEIDAHNAKAAASRAVPGKTPPTPPPPASTAAKDGGAKSKPEEQVGTPEATAKSGEEPAGQRGEAEQVGTPKAQEK